MIPILTSILSAINSKNPSKHLRSGSLGYYMSHVGNEKIGNRMFDPHPGEGDTRSDVLNALAQYNQYKYKSEHSASELMVN